MLLSLWSWGASPSKYMMYSLAWKLLEHVLLGFLWGIIMKACLLVNSISRPSPHSGGWGEAGLKNSQLQKHGLVFLVINPYWEPHRSPPRVVSIEQKMLSSLRKLWGFWELSIRNWGQRLNVRIKDLPSTPIYKNFRHSVSGNEGRDQCMYFFVLHSCTRYTNLTFISFSVLFPYLLCLLLVSLLL